eukprot:scaffold2339_cov368-Prasinococcus_capsulatus_cf.AAC.8
MKGRATPRQAALRWIGRDVACPAPTSPRGIARRLRKPCAGAIRELRGVLRAAVATTSMAAAASSLEEHSHFFDRLVQLIPASYYLPGDDHPSGAERYYRGQSQKAKDKLEQKATSKKAKRTKVSQHTDFALSPVRPKSRLVQLCGARQLDPNNAAKLDTLQAQKDKVEEDARKLREEAEGHDGAAITPEPEAAAKKRAPSSMDELRSRLQKKVQEFRNQRNADKAAKAKQWRDQAHKASKSPTSKVRGGRKSKEQMKSKGGSNGIGDDSKGKRERETANGHHEPGGGGKKVKRAAEGTDYEVHPAEQTRMKAMPITPEKTYVDVSIAYNRFEDKESDMKFKPKAGKRKLDAKTELVKATKLQQRLKQDAEDGFKRNLAEKHAWTAALQRADGKKVKDDPKRLKNTVKREQKLKEKRKVAWEERQKAQEEQQAAKQQKRKANLKARRDGKIQRKLEKREKKLSRPGFEGRRDTFLNP